MMFGQCQGSGFSGVQELDISVKILAFYLVPRFKGMC